MGEAAYDARKDAELLGANLRLWASAGFMRGLAGYRAELLPPGAMMLPSEAFHSFALKTLASDASDGTERSSREAYLGDVEDYLVEAQQKAVDRHDRLCMWGYLADIVISLASIALIVFLMTELGAFDPFTLSFLAAVGTAFIMLSFGMKRVATLTRIVFLSETDEFRLPWKQDGRPSEAPEGAL